MTENTEGGIAQVGVLLTTSEVADLLRITEQRVRGMRSQGSGPTFIKLPTGTIRYRIEDVNAWISGSSV